MEEKCKYQNRCIQFKSWGASHSCNYRICGTYDLAKACGTNMNKDYCLFEIVYNQLQSKEQECEILKEESEELKTLNNLLKLKFESTKKSLRGAKEKRTRTLTKYNRLKDFTDIVIPKYQEALDRIECFLFFDRRLGGKEILDIINETRDECNQVLRKLLRYK